MLSALAERDLCLVEFAARGAGVVDQDVEFAKVLLDGEDGIVDGRVRIDV